MCMSDKLLSIKEAASILGVNEETLRRWDRQRKVLAYRTPGGHRKYKPEDIEKLSGIVKKPVHFDGDQLLDYLGIPIDKLPYEGGQINAKKLIDIALKGRSVKTLSGISGIVKGVDFPTYWTLVILLDTGKKEPWGMNVNGIIGEGQKMIEACNEIAESFTVVNGKLERRKYREQLNEYLDAGNIDPQTHLGFLIRAYNELEEELIYLRGRSGSGRSDSVSPERQF